MKSKTRHADGGGSNLLFMRKSMEQMRCEKNRRFNKNTQIQIDQPKQRETPMQSKTRHVDGGVKNPQFETSRI